MLDLTKVVVLSLSAGAVFQDLTSRKITNQSIIAGFIVCVVALVFTSGFSGLVVGLGGFLAVLVSGLFLWQFRVLGAGDVKFMSVIALTLSWQRGLEFEFYAMVWGSLLGVFTLLLDKFLIQESRVYNFHPIMTIRSHRVRGHKVPFTVGILFGILSLWLLDSKGVHFL